MSTMAHSQNSTPLTAAWDVHVDSLELIRRRPVLPGVTWIFYSDILASMGGLDGPLPSPAVSPGLTHLLLRSGGAGVGLEEEEEETAS